MDIENIKQLAIDVNNVAAMAFQSGQQHRKKLDIDDIIDLLVAELDFDAILRWAKILDVEINYPPIDDMWPDWEDELAVEVGEAMALVGRK